MGQAKNMRIINYLGHCQKLGKFTVMSQPTILKLKVSKTGHAIITFRNFFYMHIIILKTLFSESFESFNFASSYYTNGLEIFSLHKNQKKHIKSF